MKLADQITLGTYAGQPIVWKAIGEKDGRFLLLSRDVLDYRPFHPVDTSEGMGAKSYDETNWGDCELRQWLNGTFAQTAFTVEELAHIPVVTVAYPTIYKTLHSFFRGTGQVENQIFLLSEEEVKQYLTEENDRLALLTDYARSRAKDVCPLRNYGAYWLRTTERMGYGAHAQYIYNSVFRDKLLGASVGAAGVWSTDIGVRPAMWYQP